jgi:2-haloacid dehalogenase
VFQKHHNNVFQQPIEMKSIKTIIFDLGGVLIDWNPEYVFKELLPDATKRQFFFENICTHEWNVEQDAGRLIKEATETKIQEFPEWEYEIRAFYGQWEEMLGGPIHETVQILKQLLATERYQVLALTNWSAETFPVALGLYDFLHWFEGIVVSGTEKTRKPFANIYEILLNRYKVHPETAVFIDDSLANVRGGEALGIRGIQFESAAQLKKDLHALGVFWV